MRKRLPSPAGKAGERGATIAEAAISMLMVCFVLFLLIQFAFLVIARESASYASFWTTRSLAVGFTREEAYYEGHYRAIPGSGPRVYPAPDFSLSCYDRVHHELKAIERYLQGIDSVFYKYWGKSDSDVASIDLGNTNSETAMVVDFDEATHGTTQFVSGRVFFYKYPLTAFMFSDAVSGGDPYFSIGRESIYFMPKYYQDYLKAK